MTVKPLHDRVLVRRLEEETKTAGGWENVDLHKLTGAEQVGSFRFFLSRKRQTKI